MSNICLILIVILLVFLLIGRFLLKLAIWILLIILVLALIGGGIALFFKIIEMSIYPFIGLEDKLYDRVIELTSRVFEEISDSSKLYDFLNALINGPLIMLKPKYMAEYLYFINSLGEGYDKLLFKIDLLKTIFH